MGTNYYFKVKEDFLNDAINFFKSKPFTEGVTEYLKKEYEEGIHIGKRSCGWKPLFRKTRYYSTVNEIIKFYEDNKDSLIIETEYGYVLTLDELKEELIFWNRNNHDVKEHSGGYYDENGYYFWDKWFC